MTDQHNDLLPCPFCGNEKITFRDHSHNRGYSFVSKWSASCDRCNTDVFRPSRDECAKAWNTRAEPRPDEEQPIIKLGLKAQGPDRYRECAGKLSACTTATAYNADILAKHFPDQSADKDGVWASRKMIHHKDVTIMEQHSEIERLRAEVAGTIEAAAKVDPKAKTLNDVACLLGFQFGKLSEALERVKALEEGLTKAKDALEHSYDATEWPADGSSMQELAAKEIESLLQPAKEGE